MIYYGGRVLEKTVNEDAGLEVRDGLKSLAQWGACPEVMWPYRIKDFRLKPSPMAMRSGLENRALTYAKLDQVAMVLKLCLIAGYAPVFGFTC